MLILTMRKGVPDDEEIIIGNEDVVIRLLGIRKNQARIGITTKDPNMPINRKGVYENKKQGK